MSDLTFQFESVRAVIAEPNWPDLIREHFEESAQHAGAVQIDPDYQRYIACNDIGTFRCWTARHEGRLVGYLGLWVETHPHFRRTLRACDDLYMLAPEFRRGFNGYNMFRSCFASLKASGVKMIMIHSQHSLDLSKLMERLGLTPAETLWSGML